MVRSDAVPGAALRAAARALDTTLAHADADAGRTYTVTPDTHPL